VLATAVVAEVTSYRGAVVGPCVAAESQPAISSCASEETKSCGASRTVGQEILPPLVREGIFLLAVILTKCKRLVFGRPSHHLELPDFAFMFQN